ncbi:hypothetical protein NE865_04720 [Phthorimaea operculella]|nr:hypothetical protein NE865_04720 [Phthorimaea operculella]
MTAPVFVNDVLAFLQAKLDIMDEKSAIDRCSTRFPRLDICKAKNLLIGSLKVSSKCVTPIRIIGDENGKESLQDIIQILNSIAPSDLPTFVEANRVEDIINKTQRDVQILQDRLENLQQRFESSLETISELRAELVLLRKSEIGSAVTSNIVVSERRNARADDSHKSATSAPSADLPAHRPPRAAKQTEQPARAPPAAAAAAATAPLSPPRPAAPPLPPALRVAADKTKSQRAPRGNTAKRQPQPPSNKTGKAQSRPSEPPRNTRYDQVDTEGFTLVQKKRRQRHRQNYCGTAPGEPNLALRAATPRTSLYVSRLHASTTKQDVLDYIFARHKAGVFKDSPRLGVFVEALESRYVVGFNSFLLRVPTAHLDVFTSPEFWPKGVVFRRFRGRMRNATPKLN